MKTKYQNIFCYLNLGLDIFNGIRGLNLEGDSFPREGLDKDLHSAFVFVCKFLEVLLV